VRKYVFLFGLAALFLGLATLALSESGIAPKGEITISITGKRPVSFDHPGHIRKLSEGCQVCHHENKSDTGSKCTSCHPAKKGMGEAPPAKQAFHTRCGGCHKQKGKGPLYPKDCKGCHG